MWLRLPEKKDRFEKQTKTSITPLISEFRNQWDIGCLFGKSKVAIPQWKPLLWHPKEPGRVHRLHFLQNGHRNYNFLIAHDLRIYFVFLVCPTVAD